MLALLTDTALDDDDEDDADDDADDDDDKDDADDDADDNTGVLLSYFYEFYDHHPRPCLSQPREC